MESNFLNTPLIFVWTCLSLGTYHGNSLCIWKSIIHKNLFFLFKKMYLLIFERHTERKTLIYCSTYLCIHWLVFVCALTGDWTHNLGISGQCSNQLSYRFKKKKQHSFLSVLSLSFLPPSTPYLLLICPQEQYKRNIFLMYQRPSNIWWMLYSFVLFCFRLKMVSKSFSVLAILSGSDPGC